jgi:predicted transcriptional regulator
MMIERREGTLQLIGKVHPTDQATFAALLQIQGPVTAAALTTVLQVSLNAVNERLAKLTACGVVRRQKGLSPAGREHYEYRVLA